MCLLSPGVEIQRVTARGKARTLDGMEVLVVEDDPLQRGAIVQALENMGHHVCWAETGEGALELLRTEPVDVVLLDLDLGPGIDGWEVARRKLATPKVAHVPVIVVTGRPLGEVHEQAKNPLAGAMLVLGKPTDLVLLERALDLVARGG